MTERCVEKIISDVWYVGRVIGREPWVRVAAMKSRINVPGSGWKLTMYADQGFTRNRPLREEIIPDGSLLSMLALAHDWLDRVESDNKENPGAQVSGAFSTTIVV